MNLKSEIEGIIDNSWEVKPLGRITNFRYENGKEVADIDTVFNKKKATKQILEAFRDYVEECEVEHPDTGTSQGINNSYVYGYNRGQEMYKQNLMKGFLDEENKRV